MRKILLIDKEKASVHRFKKSLTGKNSELLCRQSISQAIADIKKNSIDLIVIDNTLAPEISRTKSFGLAAGDIPKIILTDSSNSKDSILWINDESAYPVDSRISLKEFKAWVSRILKNKSLASNNKSLSSELQTKKMELNFFSDITKIFNSTSDLDISLDAIMKKAADMTGSKVWSILLSDAALLEVKPIRASKKIHPLTVDPQISIAGQVMDLGAPLVVHDASKDKRFNNKVDRYRNIKKISSMACAPLIVNNKAVGVTRLINKKNGRDFSSDDVIILTNAAHYAAMTIKRALLYYRIEEISITDDLTNMYNVRYLHQAIDIELERARRFRSVFSLIFMDIDYFKKVNDSYGHLVGSRVLIELSQVLQEHLRKIDIITRYGGDEFVILLPQAPRDASLMVAERLRKAVEKHVFLKNNKVPVRVTASFGVATYPENAENKEDLLNLADKAMYRGKNLTRNVVFAAE